MVFMSIFNFLEPGVTIIAQTIPMFRVLVVNVKNGTSAIRISSPSGVAANGSALARTWNSKSHRSRDPDEELLHVGSAHRSVHVSGPARSAGSDDGWKIYDGRN